MENHLFIFTLALLNTHSLFYDLDSTDGSNHHHVFMSLIYKLWSWQLKNRQKSTKTECDMKCKYEVNHNVPISKSLLTEEVHEYRKVHILLVLPQYPSLIVAKYTWLDVYVLYSFITPGTNVVQKKLQQPLFNKDCKVIMINCVRQVTSDTSCVTAA